MRLPKKKLGPMLFLGWENSRDEKGRGEQREEIEKGRRSKRSYV